MRYKKTNRYLIAILCLSFILNITGITWGFPATWDNDTSVKRLFWMGNHKTIIPQRFDYGTALPYLNAIVISPYILYLKATGYSFTAENINTSGPEFYNTVYLIARLTNVLFAVGIVYLTYLLGKELFNKKAGLIAALFIAITPGFIVHAHFTSVDVPSIFLMMLTLLCILIFLRKEQRRYMVIASFLIGVGISTKHVFALTLILPVFLAMLFVYKKKIMKEVVLLCIVPCIIGFLLTTPTVLIRPGQFIRDNLHTVNLFAETTVPGERGILGNYGALEHLRNLIHAMGPLLATVSIALFGGLTLSQVNNFEKKKFMIMFWAIMFFISISLLKFSPIRAVMPLLPILVIFAASYFAENFKNPLTKISLLMIILFTLYNGILVDNMIVNETRYDATNWINENIPDGAVINIIASDRYLPTIYSRNDLNSNMARIPYTGVYNMKHTPSYHVQELKPVSDYHYFRINSNKFIHFENNFKQDNLGEYVVITDSYYGRFFDEAFVEGAHSSESFSLISQFYAKLLNEEYGSIIADFYYDTNKYPTVPFISPRITIIKIGEEIK